MTDTKANDAPERIWIAGLLDECGHYYPNATEAEGEHGGAAAEYVRADLLADMTRQRDEARAENRWPDFMAPPKYASPDPRWKDPALPDFRLIWQVARACGYAVGLHGSMMRDCDLIAAPWTDNAVGAFDLIERLCNAMNAKTVGGIARKPHGRLGWILQIDGYVKHIDISVMPMGQDRALAEGTKP